MRTFIAIELPQEIKDSLAQLQDKLKASGADIKWVEPQNIHLTLKFLGEINEDKLNKVISIMESVAESTKPFDICICSVGAFPRISSPRVIWVGLDKGDTESKAIAKSLEEKIQKLGIPKEKRPFSSHITLGRTKSSLNMVKLVRDLKPRINDFGIENLEFLVTKITLFKSTLTPKGPVYEALKQTSLKAT